MNTENEKRQLLEKRAALILSKREHETKLVAVKNVVRSGGRLPSEKYKQCCDSQNTHARAIMHIENEMSKIKTRLREIADIEFNEKNGLVKDKQPEPESVPVKSIVVELVSLRQAYQDFAADGTRVSSMRQMAAEFVVKLNPIIKRAIGVD